MSRRLQIERSAVTLHQVAPDKGGSGLRTWFENHSEHGPGGPCQLFGGPVRARAAQVVSALATRTARGCSWADMLLPQKIGKAIGICGIILEMYWFTIWFKIAIRLFGT